MDTKNLDAKLEEKLKSWATHTEAVERFTGDFNTVAAHFLQAVSSQVKHYEFLSERAKDGNFIDPLNPALRQSSKADMALNLLVELKIGAVQARVDPDAYRDRFMAAYLRFNKTVNTNGIHAETLDRLTQTVEKHWKTLENHWSIHELKSKAVARYSGAKKKSKRVTASKGKSRGENER